MCRTGGRRCPSHLSDLARRARNAQRRAEYSAMKVESLDKLLDAAMVKDDTAQAYKILDQIEKHQESMELSKHEATSLKKQYLQSIAENALLSDEQGAKPDESLNGDSMESEKLKIRSAVSSLPEVFGGREYEGFSGKDLFDDTDEITSANPELGIYKTRNTGKLARLRYFNAETIRGKIVKSKLDKNSAHKDFGFRKVNPEGYEIVSFNDVGDNELYGAGIKEKIIAKTEIGDIDMDSERSVRGFTRSDFRDINGLLYDGKNYDGENKVPQHIQTSIEGIDTVLDKGSKRQRYLYRAMSSESNAMSGYKSAEEWVDSKYTMGEDVVFDGYQSSSSEKGGISSFAAENGVVFEILTPEGANITEISNYEQECETLLPRNARYKVVGIEKNVRITLQKRSTGLYGNTIVRLVAVNSKGEVLDGTNADEITPVDELENRRNNKQEEAL